MRISAARLIPYRLPFKQPWRTHRGTLRERIGWLLELSSDLGLLGYGDCAPLPDAGTETADEAYRWLNARSSALSGSTPSAALDTLPDNGGTPAARHALETALLDLISQTEGISLRRWLSPSVIDAVRVNAACGVLDDGVFKRCEQSIHRGFKTLKLKVGLNNVERELSLLQRLSQALPDDVDLRLDANGAWNLAEAGRFITGLQGLPVESLEEPLHDPDAQSLRELQDATQIPLALDESLNHFSAAELFERPPVRRLILKPCVLGGLLTARDIAERARQAGMQTVITSTLESAVGIQAAAQLAMALASPLAQGLATSDWYTEDVAEPPSIMQGRLRLPETAGLGIRLPHPPGESS